MEQKELPEVLSGILALLKQNDVTNFELTSGDLQLRLERGVAYAAAPSPVARVEQAITTMSPAAGSVVANASGSSAEHPSHLTKVESPIVGSFYRRPSPDKEPFVKEGDVVSKGDTLCIVEAMKLMNEIEAPASGKVVKILAVDGKVVEFGEVLFLIDPSAA